MKPELLCSVWIFLLTTQRHVCAGFLFEKKQNKLDSISLFPTDPLQGRFSDVSKRGRLLAPTSWYTKALNPSNQFFQSSKDCLPFQNDVSQKTGDTTDLKKINATPQEFIEAVGSFVARTELGVQSDFAQKKAARKLLLIQESKGDDRRNDASGTSPKRPWGPVRLQDKYHGWRQNNLQAILSTLLGKRFEPISLERKLLERTFVGESRVPHRMTRNSESLNGSVGNTPAPFSVSRLGDSSLLPLHLTGPSAQPVTRPEKPEQTGVGDDSVQRRSPDKASDSELPGESLGVIQDEAPDKYGAVDSNLFLSIGDYPTPSPAASLSANDQDEPLLTPSPVPSRYEKTPTAAPTPKPWPRTSSPPITPMTTKYAVPTPLGGGYTTLPQIDEAMFLPSVSSLGGVLGVNLETEAPSVQLRQEPCETLNQPVIVRDSLPCLGRRRREVSLNPGQLSALLRQLGGDASSPFTAITMEEAHSKFRNMLSVGLPDKDRYLLEKYSTSQLQHILEEYHERLNLFVNDAAKKWNRQQDIENSLQNSSHQNTLSQWHHEQLKEKDNNQTITRPEAHKLSDMSWLSDSHFPVEFLHQMVPANQVMEHGRRMRKRQTGNTQHYCTSTTDDSSGFLNLCSSCQVTTELNNNFFPRVLNEIICNPQMNNTCINYQGVNRLFGQDHKTLTGRTRQRKLKHVVDFLFILLEPPGMFNLSPYPPPESRQDVFSSILWADGDVKLAGHGICEQSTLRIQMLRRQPGRCMTIDLQDTTMMVDKWDLYSQVVRAGCVCKLDKRSVLARDATV